MEDSGLAVLVKDYADLIMSQAEREGIDNVDKTWTAVGQVIADQRKETLPAPEEDIGYEFHNHYNWQ